MSAVGPLVEPTPGLNPPAPARVTTMGRLRAVGRFLRDDYMTIDPRTLGLFRLVLGFVLSADLVRHWKEARWFYSNEGVLTNHYHLFRPSSGYNFSLFHAFSSLGEVHVAFALAFVCHVLFFVGWHTRLFSILSFLVVTSLDNRLVMVENGGYVVVNLITAWAMFMPLGRRFSIDALVRSYRERVERTADDLNARGRLAAAAAPFVSGIVMLATVNLAVVYLFNVVNKSGVIWRHGDTVHYVLYLNRMVTGVAVFFREHLPLWSMRVLTWAVLDIEALIFFWILAPRGRRLIRLLALLAIWALHGTFGIMMRLGPFSWFLIAWSFLLIVPEHWDMLAAWYRRRAKPRLVVYDRASPLAFAAARLLARLDALELIRFEPSSAPSGNGDPNTSATYRDVGPPAPEPELLTVRDPEDGRTFVGVAALREIARVLPGGRFWWPLVGIATFGTTGALYALVARKRAALARFFGLTVPPRAEARPPRTSPLGRAFGAARVALRELTIAFLAFCAVSQAIDENKSIPQDLTLKAALAEGTRARRTLESIVGKRVVDRVADFSVPIKHKQSKIIEAMLQYPRMFQGWGMFAPNPIQEDGSLAIDAITVDGRHIDPFTKQPPDLDLTDARGLGLNQIWQDYFNRIRFDRNKVFRQGLQEYLMRWHLETGRQEDELVSFDVFWVRDNCPRPGERVPYGNEAIPILSWRKPHYTPPPGQPPLPKELEVKSAGN